MKVVYSPWSDQDHPGHLPLPELSLAVHEEARAGGGVVYRDAFKDALIHGISKELFNPELKLWPGIMMICLMLV